MKFVGTKIKKNLGDLSKHIPEVVTNSFAVLDTLLEVAPVCMSYEEYKQEVGEIDEFEFYQLDELEKLLQLEGCSILENFAVALSAKDLVTNRRLMSSIDFRKRLIATLEVVEAAYIPLNQKELARIRTLFGQTIGHITTFLYSQFEMGVTLDAVNENEDPSVNIDIFKYAESVNKDVITLEKEVYNAMVKYRPSLPVFEEYPELEEEFYDIAGPYIQDFEILEGLITSEDVKLVLENSNLDLEAFIEEIKARGQVRDESDTPDFDAKDVRAAFSGDVDKLKVFK